MKLFKYVIYLLQFIIGNVVGLIPFIDLLGISTIWCKLTPANLLLDAFIFVSGLTTAYYGEKNLEKL